MTRIKIVYRPKKRGLPPGWDSWVEVENPPGYWYGHKAATRALSKEMARHWARLATPEAIALYGQR